MNDKTKRHSLAKRLKKINQLGKSLEVQKKKIQLSILEEMEDASLRQEKYDDGMKVVVCERTTTALSTTLLAKRLKMKQTDIERLLEECRVITGVSTYPIVSW